MGVAVSVTGYYGKINDLPLIVYDQMQPKPVKIPDGRLAPLRNVPKNLVVKYTLVVTYPYGCRIHKADPRTGSALHHF
jgi:hypothetical protein